MIKKAIISFSTLAVIAITAFVVVKNSSKDALLSPLTQIITPTPKPLERFTFDALKKTPIKESLITLETQTATESSFNTFTFSYTSDNKKITGQLNVPTAATPSAGFPVIVLLRGFVDPAIYQTGVGTKNAARYFAANGFVTLAPDFLGYGGSDQPDNDSIAARLHHPLDVITLLQSIKNLSYTNPDQIGLWAHSNGGQIALSVLEITGKAYPTTLWAPVSKAFPYSILYYTDEFDDGGKALRKVLANFEKDYDVFLYSIDNYYPYITAPIQIHQGTYDDAIPVEWSQNLEKTLKKQKTDVELFIYPGADHNLRPSWDTVVARDLVFYKRHLQSP